MIRMVGRIVKAMNNLFVKLFGFFEGSLPPMPTLVSLPPLRTLTLLPTLTKGLFALAFILFTTATATAAIADLNDAMAEKSLGDANAPVVLEEFASLTCHHCATFHSNVLPKLKEKYINTGKLKFIYRDFPLDIFALRASQVARCVGDDKFFTFIDVFYKNQRKWITSDDPLKSLLQMARQGGMSGEDFRQCVGHEGMEDALLKNRLQYQKRWKITATPTLVLNGKKFEASLDTLEKAIEAELP